VSDDPYAAYFAPDHLLKIDIEMSSSDWSAMRFQGRTKEEIIEQFCDRDLDEDVFDFFPANVTVDGVKMEEVGIRKKGFLGSLSRSKPSLKIKMHEYHPEQTLNGVKRLTLNNARQDPSMLNTCMTYSIFHAAGYPAPRCNFAHVTVNGADLGPYVHVESMKRPLLEAHFGDPDGAFYEGQISDFRPELDWSFLTKHDEMSQEKADIALATETLLRNDSGWYEAVEQLFDIDAYLTFWAIEVLTGHWDSYNGNRNNFYVYNDPEQERFVFLPWGADSAFKPLSNPFDNIDYPASLSVNGKLGHRLWERPEIREAYVERMNELLDTAWDEDFLNAEIQRISSMIYPLMSSTSRTYAEADLRRVEDFVDEQRSAVLDSMKNGPPEWEHELPNIWCP